jgi:hypothetical protein
MWNDAKSDPRRQAQVLVWTIVVVVTMVLAAMWTGAGISIKQSQDAARKNLKADAANLAFAFDEDVTSYARQHCRNHGRGRQAHGYQAIRRGSL